MGRKFSLTRLQAMSIGAMIITPISIYQEKLAARLGKLSTSPEARLYFPCAMSILLPVGLFWFGWSSLVHHWIVPALAVACSTMGIFSVYLAVFNYFADTYHRYASSAIAAAGFSMLTFSFLLPHGSFKQDLQCQFHRSKHAGWCISSGHKCPV